MGKRRYPGVTPLGDGWYRLRTEVRHPKTDRVHELDRKAEASSDREAANLLAIVRADWLRIHGAPAKRARQRLADALATWLEKQRPPMVAPSTAEKYAYVAAWWTTVLGDYFVDAIAPDDVFAALDGSREGGAEHATRLTRLTTLRTFARASGCAAIVEGVSIGKKGVREAEADEDEGRGFDVAELRRFLAAGPRAWRTRVKREVHERWPRAWALVATLAWTGLRFGEASALEWPDIDFEAMLLRVRRAQWRGIVGHPKAKASKRVVVMTDELATLLHEHRDRMLRKQARGIESALVFPSPRYGNASKSKRGGDVEYVTNGYVADAIAKVCEAAKIDLGNRPAVHVLRHSMNNLVRQCTTESVRQSLIGHATKASGKAYEDVTEGEKRTAMLAVVRSIKGGT